MTAPLDPSPLLLEKNLRAIAAHDPDTAKAVADASAPDLDWAQARTGDPVALVKAEGAARPIALASRYEPRQEAERLIDAVDFEKSAAVVAIGFGLGYHVRTAYDRMLAGGSFGLVAVLEPDAGLLKAVLSRLDYSDWLGDRRLVLAVGEGAQRGGLVRRFDPHGAAVTQGTHLLVHPPTRQLRPDDVAELSDAVKEVVAYLRTTVATALVNSSRTCANLVANLDLYAGGAGTDALHNAARGVPAVLVAAGPSLVKNVDRLRDPALRQRVVVIAVQTALRPLLERGIRPDFVTALDYSAICTRFYEDLPDRLDDVTLVVEPKVNPAVVDAYPGPVRSVPNEFADKLLEDPQPRINLPGGATVAHLSFYLARHLGCDPITFIGQDLAFSHGLYYCPGTAVHKVWEPEISPFNTVEMLEWTRIVRMRGHLRRIDDIHGRSAYTDEQMTTYRKQFERDFEKAVDQGAVILDASEGGAPKSGAESVTFEQALERFDPDARPDLPTASRGYDAGRLASLVRRLDERTAQIRELRQVTQQTIPILQDMTAAVDDSARFNRLHQDLSRNQKRAEHDLAPAFKLVMQVNTIGAYRRVRADRNIRQSQGDERDKRLAQIDRDIENLRFLVEACDEALGMLDEGLDRARQGLAQAKRLAKPPVNGARAA
ncbi:MAG: 6-hydroxymethylpterin diphosphokinase MptE-like protein [Planctomycetota bacterium]